MRVIDPVENLLGDVLFGGTTKNCCNYNSKNNSSMANKKRKHQQTAATVNNKSGNRKKSNSIGSQNSTPFIDDDDINDDQKDIDSPTDVNTKATTTSCPHLKGNLNAGQVRKKLKDVIDFSCLECRKLPPKTNDDGDVCCCLLCGYLGCSRYSDHQHAIKHFETPRNGLHCVVLNLRTFDLWCYKCDDAVVLTSATAQLKDLVDWIGRKIKNGGGGGKSEMSPSTTGIITNNNNNEEESKKSSTSKIKAVGSGQMTTRRKAAAENNSSSSSEIKGLSNLGNTCFFNSVLQTLAQTHPLQFVLNDPDTFLKGGKIVVHPVVTENGVKPPSLDPVEVKLDTDPGTLAAELRSFLTKFRSQNNSSILNPASLFGQVCKRAPRFRGYQQQDSHELLRYMLDALKTEETKRLRASLVRSFGIDPGDRAKVESLDAKMKTYDALHHTTFVEEVFGGQLLQTITCLECHNISKRYEQFLDLSLPIIVDSANKASGGKASSTNTTSASNAQKKDCSDKSSGKSTVAAEQLLSKHKQKKANKNTRKNAKASRRRNSSSTTVENENENGNAIGSAPIPGEMTESSGLLLEDGDMAGLASDFGSSLALSPNEEGSQKKEGDASTTTTTVVLENGFSNLTPPDNGENEDLNLDEDLDLDDERKKPQIVKSADTALVEPLNPNIAEECAVSSGGGELTLMTCLRNFTAPELLTGKNRFGCENCGKSKSNFSNKVEAAEDVVKRSGGGTNKKECSSTNNPPVAYTDAEKRYWIYSPPAVLTLHLKRFQQSGAGMRKVTKRVDFPALLDVSPYCCKNGKRYNSSQKRILYSLYGVVSHSGGMSGGHYVAYVRVRPGNNEHFLPRRFTAKNGPSADAQNGLGGEGKRENGITSISGDASSCEKKSAGEENGENGVSAETAGTWYYVSDTHVNQVPLNKVLAAEAYLLFYERIS